MKYRGAGSGGSSSAVAAPTPCVTRTLSPHSELMRLYEISLRESL